jgi:glycosyltransferase involved in cell wall biosynthesis
MPRVFLDLTPLATQSTLRGIGRYVRGLARGFSELGPQSDLEISGLIADHAGKRLDLVGDIWGEASKPVVAPLRKSGKRRDRLITNVALGWAKEQGVLLHLTEPTNYVYPRERDHAVTCHDLIPLVLHKEYLSKWPWARSYRAKLERARYGNARRVLAVSNATKRDVCEQLGIAAERVDVVWHGVDQQLFQAQAGEGERAEITKALGGTTPYVLYVGAGDPRKDLDTLLQAFANSRLAREALLVIAGELRPKRRAELQRAAERAGVAEKLKLLGYVDEALVPKLYRNAALHVFPSRYEGFGFPVVEALACGTPTITSPGSSLDEVAGDAALIVPCQQVEPMLAALERLFFDAELCASLRGKGLARAATFTWRACAENTLAFWRRALSGS